MNRLRRLGLVVAIVATGAVLAPSGPAGAAGTSGCAKRAGDVPVAVVVDFGTVAGSPGGVSQVCVPVTDRTNGAALLTARAQLLGVPAPRYNASGLLCAIDGYPASGCGESNGGVSQYWSYWLGDNAGWGYASIGPAAHRVDSNVTEGWRFVEGTGTANEPVPRGPSVSTAICQQITPGTSTTGGAISTGGNSSLDGTGGTATGGGTTGTTGDDAGTTGGTTGPQVDDPAADAKIVTMPSLPTASTTTTTLPGATTTVPAGKAKAAIGSTEAERRRAAEPAQRILAASAAKKDSGGPGDLLGPVAIVAVVAVLIVGGIWQARRRRAG